MQTILQSPEQSVEQKSPGRTAEEARPAGGEQDGGGEQRGRELGVWMCALESFFRVSNHPLSEAEREELPARDFGGETRAAQAVLLRCSQLAYTLDEPACFFDPPRAELDFGGGAADEFSCGVLGPSAALREACRDAWTAAQSLLKGGHVGLQEWAGLGRALGREFGRQGAARALMCAARRPTAPLQTELIELSERVLPDALGACVFNVFARLALLLERLRFVEQLLRRDQPLKQSLPVFTLVHEEALGLLEMIEARALRAECIAEEVFESLDGTAYALRMELRKAFEHELVGLMALRPATQVYAKVEAAHGLLRDCFQQSTVSLAQVFNPALDGARLFESFQTKLEQSLTLRSELWALLEFVRAAERQRERRLTVELRRRLSTFREGGMRLLMYKDWEAFERFAEEVNAARGAAETGPVLHRFSAYLETLFGQVNMRAVLADRPFDPASADA